MGHKGPYQPTLSSLPNCNASFAILRRRPPPSFSAGASIAKAFVDKFATLLKVKPSKNHPASELLSVLGARLHKAPTSKPNVQNNPSKRRRPDVFVWTVASLEEFGHHWTIGEICCGKPSKAISRKLKVFWPSEDRKDIHNSV